MAETVVNPHLHRPRRGFKMDFEDEDEDDDEKECAFSLTLIGFAGYADNS
jgi:hypothetical protein